MQLPLIWEIAGAIQEISCHDCTFSFHNRSATATDYGGVDATGQMDSVVQILL